MTKVRQSTPAIDPWLDFQALCHLGGRLCGTSSEVDARLYLTRRLKKLAIKYGGRFASLPIEYLGWSATKGKIISKKTSQKYGGQPLLYSPSTAPGARRLHRNMVASHYCTLLLLRQAESRPTLSIWAAVQRVILGKKREKLLAS